MIRQLSEDRTGVQGQVFASQPVGYRLPALSVGWFDVVVHGSDEIFNIRSFAGATGPGIRPLMFRSPAAHPPGVGHRVIPRPAEGVDLWPTSRSRTLRNRSFGHWSSANMAS